MIVAILVVLGSASAATFISAYVLSRTRPPLYAYGDGRQIGGPGLVSGLGVGIACGTIFSFPNPFLLAGMGIIAALGLLDDVLDLPPWRKLVGQSVAAAIITVGIGKIAVFSIVGLSIPVGIGGYPLVFLWILTLTNGVNLIDGLDGLALGVAGPAVLGLLLLTGIVSDQTGMVLTAALLGGIVGFYPWNRFPARLLLGDTGAELIGYLLAVMMVHVLTHGGRPLPILPAILFALVPLTDTTFAVVRRVYHHHAVFQGDQAHIHHRLKNRIGEKKAVLVLSALSTVSTGIGIILWLIGR